MKRVICTAIVYPYWPHYREAVVNVLCKQKFPQPRYVLFSDSKSNNDIATIDPKRSGISFRNGGLTWRIIRNYWITKDILWQSGVIKLALSNEFDSIIYYGQMYFISTWISAIIARISGKRVLMWTHGYIREENNLKGWLRAYFYKIAHGILLYGNRARNIMINKGFEKKSLYVIFNSLDYASQKSIREKIYEKDCLKLRQQLFPQENLPVVLFIGRLTPKKKLDMLLRASLILSKQNMKVNIIFVGGGKDRDRLERLTKELKLDERVRFIGPCYDETKLAKMIMISSVCVAPGEVGLTAMHSLAYGTPVITHDNFSKQMPEYEAIQEGISGSFFQEGNIEDLVRKIKVWLSKDRSKDEIRKRCVEIIEKYYNPEYQCENINKAVMGYPSEL